ncbi:MAG: Inner membrane protein YccS [Candidatus Erwinia impunctatus]|nr:Inner membrane protein YccS [Culicoides impunctatus]
MITPRLRHVTANGQLLYALRIFIALAGCAGAAWWTNHITWTIPLTLGVVAAGLADLDDRFSGRLLNLFITLVCFCLASVSVELLSPHPWLFIIGLTLSTWGFILLGALGQRYATIAFGALLIALYTLLGTGQFTEWYLQPILLVAGAIWYNLLTLAGHVLFPIRPVQEKLAYCFTELAGYLDAKASVFDPDIEANDNQALIDVAMSNSRLVATLNQTRASIQSRLKGDRGQRSTRRTLHYYFVAQDIHERASSSHVDYHRLRQTFRYSDILFRFQWLLTMQARACQQLARCILLQDAYQHNPHFDRVFQHLTTTLEHLNTLHPRSREIQAMRHLLNNLRAIDGQLATIESQQAVAATPDNTHYTLRGDGLTGWHNIRLRLQRELTPESALFRHAVRMSLVLCTGYAFIQLTGLDHGYWILLTSLFVCQPNYSATRQRLALRIGGTLAGVLIGLPLLWMIPAVEAQLALIVLFGVLFFIFRQSQYAQATMFITLLVLFCFNLLGEGYQVALPRIFDTFIGCAIAWCAVEFIWPDWHFRRLPHVATRTFAANCRYLDAIVIQYHQGKDNRLDYRIARRDAHNDDALLASVVSQLSVERNVSDAYREKAFRLLCLNHSSLSYISALGAHREKSDNLTLLSLLDEVVCYIDALSDTTDVSAPAYPDKHPSNLVSRIENIEAVPESKDSLILQQIGLLITLLPEIRALTKELADSNVSC